MKTRYLKFLIGAVCLVVLAGRFAAQTTTSDPTSGQNATVPPPTPYQVVMQDGNSRVWQSEEYEMSPDGHIVAHQHSYTELNAGVNYWSNGEWVPSKEEIDLQPDGSAAALAGAHQMRFPADIYQGSIQMTTPDGLTLQSQPAALAYDDGQNTVIIGVLTNSVGQLIGPNQVLYTNAFSGIDASILYTYTQSGVEQDIVLRTQPVTPDSLGLNPATAKLQVLTEFLNPPSPAESPVADPNENGLTDTSLKFGTTTLGHGRAFLLGDQTESANPGARIRVYKSWISSEGRTFLIEAVPYHRIVSQMQSLPTSSSTATPSRSLLYAQHPSGHYEVPPARVATAGSSKARFARTASLSGKGLVLDYVTINAAQTNYTFKGDTTYYVTGAYDLIGATTFEGGTVIKMTGNGKLEIDSAGSVNCKGGPYHPTVFTSYRDGSVGEITGSGSPAFGDVTNFLDVNATSVTLHDLRFSYSWYAVALGSWGFDYSQDALWNCQFENVDVAVFGYDVNLYNTLIARSGNHDPAVYIEGTNMVAQNVTADGGNSLIYVGGSPSVALTNCLITGQPIGAAGATVVTNSTACISSITGPIYQATGAGAYYLTNGSSYRSNGTPNIDPTLFAELANKTTHPPMVYSNLTYSVVTNFSPQAARDTNGNPDIGYHYDPLDYLFGNVVAATNMTFAAGTAVGWYDSSGYGIGADPDIQIRFNGTATQPCIFAHYATVQEENVPAWKGASPYWFGVASIGTEADPTYAATVSPVFTHAYSLGDTHQIIGDESSVLRISAKNSEFYCGALGGYGDNYFLTNCLIDRVYVSAQAACCAQIAWQNCTLHGATLAFTHWGAWPVAITNCAFDGVIFYVDSTDMACGNNAYVTNGATLPITEASDVYVTNFNWQTSSFGTYYLPTNSLLIDKGNTNANLLGLYHFTTQTNQTVEGNSIADIGYHYVATDTNGMPLDSNGDGVPDYIQDANGDGLVDNGETNWALAILTQPLSTNALVGSVTEFHVIADGIGPIGYQWLFNGTNLPGETFRYCIMGPVVTNEAGTYSVIVSNWSGTITSAAAMLTVCTPTLGAISNVTVTAGSGTNMVNLTGISSGCSPFIITQFGASSSDATIVSNFNVNYSGGSTGTLTFVPSATTTGTVTVTVAFLAEDTNKINGGLALTTTMDYDPSWGLNVTNFIPYGTNGAVLQGHGGIFANTNVFNLTFGFSPIVLQPLTDIPPVMPNLGYLSFTNNGNVFLYDCEEASYAAPYGIPSSIVYVPLRGIAHLHGFDDTPGYFSFESTIYNSATGPSIPFGGSGFFGSSAENIQTFQVTVLPPSNQLTVQILSPINQVIQARTNVVITAFATNSSPAFPVDWVEFFSGTNNLGYAVSTNGIFQISWWPPQPGTNILTAYAVNTNGITAWSAPVTNYVRGLPSVTINSPTSGEYFHATPTNLIILATATADRSAITNVAFYSGTNLLGNATNGIANVYSITNRMTNGFYTLTAVATDTNGATGQSYPVAIVIDPTNFPPEVYAGPDQTNTVGDIVPLDGFATDDGLPNNALTVTWSEVSGPTDGMVTFANSNIDMTTATFSTNGVYVLQLVADDGVLSATSTVTITMLVSNAPPVVYAGPNQSLLNKISYYYTSTQLQGAASDDGNPVGSSLTTFWSEASGPGGVIFADPNRTNTPVSFDVPGTYDLRLSAYDGQLVRTSDVTITIETLDALPYRSTDWTYIYEGETRLDGFEATNFDDSAWTNGTAAFGTDHAHGDTGACELNNNNTNHVKTFWGPTGTILLRHHFNIPPGTTNLSIGFMIDNDAQIFLNGALLTTNVSPELITQIYTNHPDTTIEGVSCSSIFAGGGPDPSGCFTSAPPGWYIHGGCALDDDLVLDGISTNLWHTNDNVIAIRAYNCSGEGYVDIRVSPNDYLGGVSNQPPLVFAGLSINTIFDGTSFVLTGAVMDDGLPTNGVLSATWSQLSGPGTMYFSPTTTNGIDGYGLVQTVISANQPGTYVIQLVADDGQYTATDDVTATYTKYSDLTDYAAPTMGFITPTNGQPFSLGTSIPINVWASATTGAVARVEFHTLNGIQDNLIGIATTNPFSMTWINPPVGADTITAIAFDGAERSTATNVTVQVSSHLPPVAEEDDITVETDSKNNYLNVLSNDYDPEGNPMRIVAIKAPKYGMAQIINNGTAISYTPEPGTRGNPGQVADGFAYQITDVNGGTSWGAIYMFVNGEDVPQVNLTATSSSTTVGTLDPIMATVNPSDKIAKVDFYLGQTLIEEVTTGSGGTYTLNWYATYDPTSRGQISATATDIFGQVGVAQAITVNVSVPSGIGSPIASLDSITGSSGPEILTTNLNLIRDGMFQLYGRAYHTHGSNVTWQVGVYGIDGTFIRNVSAVMNYTAGSATVSSNLLTCDLTTLMNGVYDLRLTVTGGYETTETNVLIQLESDLKLGQFSFSQQDLILPVNGVPLTVTRTYNSINPEKGDFGYGWTYALADMNASIDETRRDVTDTDGIQFSERDGGSWDVTLTLPNGQVTTFAFALVQGNFGALDAAWLSAPGVTAKLDLPQGANHELEVLLDSLTGQPNLLYWAATGPATPMDNYDFPGFVLTTEDGTKYTLRRDDLGNHFIDNGSDEGAYRQAYGALHLTQIQEPSGDIISISPNAIVHTAPTGATNAIVFERNQDNLITAVSDPDGIAGGSGAFPFAKYDYDAQDNLIDVQNLVGRNAGAYVTNYFTYTNANFPHYITGIINADGTQVAKNFYDDSGKLSAVQDANGNLTQFIHNLTNNIEATIDRDGFTNTFVYDLRGNVILQTNQVGEITSMEYDAFNNKTNEIMYMYGVPYATNSYVYDTNLEQVILSIDALGHTTSTTYDTNGRVTSITDARMNTTTNWYDGYGNLIATADALTNVTTHSYAGSQMLGTVDPIGTLTTNYYDPSTGYLLATATIDGSGILSSNTYVYDGNGNQTNSTSWRRVGGAWAGSVTTTVYDGMNRVVETIAPDGGVSTTIYDAIGKTVATVDALGRTNSFVYDALGRQIIAIYPDGTGTTNEYDANGWVTNRLDQAGNATAAVFDDLGRQIETIYADGATNATVYDGVGRVSQSIDSLGNITAYGYDVAGRRLTVTNGLGSPVQMTNADSYDANGNQVTMTDGNGHTTTSVYDALNRQVQTLYADGSSNSLAYDAAGRKVMEINADMVTNLYGYDGSGRLTRVTNGVNTAEVMVTRYQYDEAGNETAQIDGLNRTNLYQYDAMSRRLWHELPTNSLVERFNYDLAGNLILQTNFNGAVITNQYDGLNRLTNRMSVGGYAASFGYVNTGQRLWMSDLSGYTRYQYDNRLRLTYKEDDLTNNAGLGMRYYYDANGNLTDMNDGRDEGYAYDALNRLTTVYGHASVTYDYDGAGNLQGMTYGGNTLTNLYQYDALNRLTNLVWMTNGNLAASFAYKTKLDGTRTNAVEMVKGVSHTDDWSYDHLYRLTGESITGLGTNGYVYDAAGNRLGRQSNVLPPATYAYNGNDRLTTDGYDNNGNTTTNAAGTTNYVYDAMNELISVNGGQIQYWYDGDGNRVMKAVGGTTTAYCVDDRNPSGYAQVMDEYSGTWTRSYDYGLGLLAEEFPQTGVTVYYGMDGHGSVRFLAQTDGTITDTYWYDAYGTIISRSGTTQNNYLYCAQQWDPDLGMYYNRARYLNTDTGRFWSSDSTEGNNEDPLSLHKYLYGADDPVNATDPSGNQIAGEIELCNSFSGVDNVSTPAAHLVVRQARQVASNRPSSAILWVQYQKVDYEAVDPTDKAALTRFWKNVIGGTFGAWGAIPDQYGNPQETCATRLSWSMNHAGLPIPASSKFNTWKNSDGAHYIPRAVNMHAYLTSIWGLPDDSVIADDTGVSKQKIEGQLSSGQIAVFACSGHIGVIKSGYNDPYVAGFSADVWFLNK